MGTFNVPENLIMKFPGNIGGKVPVLSCKQGGTAIFLRRRHRPEGDQRFPLVLTTSPLIGTPIIIFHSFILQQKEISSLLLRKIFQAQNIGGGHGKFGTHDLAGALRIRSLVVGCRTRVADGSDISKIPQRQPETRPGPRTGSQVQVGTRRRVSGRTREHGGLGGGGGLRGSRTQQQNEREEDKIGANKLKCDLRSIKPKLA